MLQVANNFFLDLNRIHNHLKDIPLYTQNEFNNITNTKDSWPGLRSLEIFDNHPFLGFLFLNEFRRNFTGIDIRGLDIGLYLHLRLGEDQDKDWIHTDSGVYTCIIYLNDTNYESGTQLFDEIKKEDYRIISDTKYVKNTAIIFNSATPHRSILNFGTDIHNGRLTLNAFFYSN